MVFEKNFIWHGEKKLVEERDLLGFLKTLNGEFITQDKLKEIQKISRNLKGLENKKVNEKNSEVKAFKKDIEKLKKQIDKTKKDFLKDIDEAIKKGIKEIESHISKKIENLDEENKEKYNSELVSGNEDNEEDVKDNEGEEEEYTPSEFL
ncbi:hypothetical protein KAI04_00055 [Candidatus Pacearchaeota archaeon]|nr:hypothetical protein [Candidatus Pacearchaeota archaeon]